MQRFCHLAIFITFALVLYSNWCDRVRRNLNYVLAGAHAKEKCARVTRATAFTGSKMARQLYETWERSGETLSPRGFINGYPLVLDAGTNRNAMYGRCVVLLLCIRFRAFLMLRSSRLRAAFFKLITGRVWKGQYKHAVL